MALEGNIEDFSVAEIIQVIGMGRKTGTLVIEGAREQVSIYFKDGKAVYANPVYQREQLGNILVKQGIVTRDDINEALAYQRGLDGRGESVRIGSILVSMGVITLERLSKYVAEQIKETVYTIMAEKKGRFKFSPELDLSTDDIIIGLNIEGVILEGARRIDEWELIKDKLPDFDDVYSINANPSENDEIQLAIDEWKILSLVDGRRSINDIIEVARFSRFDICKIIYNFVQLKLVRKLADDTDRRPVETRRIDAPKAERGIIRRLMDRIRGV